MLFRANLIWMAQGRVRCGLKPTPRLPESRLVLAGVWIDGREVPVALLVDRVEGLVRLSPNDIRRTPPFGTRLPSELVDGMAPTGEEFAPILATSRALSPYEGRRAFTAPAPPAPPHETENDFPAQKPAAKPRTRRRKSAGR